jgi:hypothetical protein
MIAISSFRPFELCSPTIRHNQIRAFKSWMLAFERVIYLGTPCPELSGILSEFIPTEGKPSIKRICQIASSTGVWTAIINADIVVVPKLKQVELSMNHKGVECGVSERFDLDSGFKIDQGLDMFVAKPNVWSQAALRVPDDFTLGRTLWDNWMLGFMCVNFGRKCADFTPTKCVYHPKHEDRIDQNWESPSREDKYATTHYWPTTTIW